jgi:hypothetical protein
VCALRCLPACPTTHRLCTSPLVPPFRVASSPFCSAAVQRTHALATPLLNQSGHLPAAPTLPAGHDALVPASNLTDGLSATTVDKPASAHSAASEPLLGVAAHNRTRNIVDSLATTTQQQQQQVAGTAGWLSPGVVDLGSLSATNPGHCKHACICCTHAQRACMRMHVTVRCWQAA